MARRRSRAGARAPVARDARDDLDEDGGGERDAEREAENGPAATPDARSQEFGPRAHAPLAPPAMRVLITGGAGSIGSDLADWLLAEGHDVRVLDNLDPQVHRDGQWPDDLDAGVELARSETS